MSNSTQAQDQFRHRRSVSTTSFPDGSRPFSRSACAASRRKPCESLHPTTLVTSMKVFSTCFFLRVLPEKFFREPAHTCFVRGDALRETPGGRKPRDEKSYRPPSRVFPRSCSGPGHRMLPLPWPARHAGARTKTHSCRCPSELLYPRFS